MHISMKHMYQKPLHFCIVRSGFLEVFVLCFYFIMGKPGKLREDKNKAQGVSVFYFLSMTRLLCFLKKPEKKSRENPNISEIC